MATVNPNTTVAATVPPASTKTKKRREKKSWNVVLTSPDGRVAKVTASKKGDGTARTQVVHSTPIAGGKKRKNERGATEVHANIEAAMKTKDKLVAEMAKRGWVVKESAPRGFQIRPDVFSVDNLPVASKSKKK